MSALIKRFLAAAGIAALFSSSGHAGNYTFSTTSSLLKDMPHGTAVTWGLYGTTYGGNYATLFNDINTSGLVVTSATLTLTNIYDWTGEATDPADALFINILAGLDNGIKSKAFSTGTDPSSSWSLAVNPFVDVPTTNGDFNDILQGGTPLNFTDAVNGSLLNYTGTDIKAGTPSYITWSDPDGPTTHSNLVIQFTSANLAVLTALLDADVSGTSAPTVGLGFAAECHYYMDGVTLTVTTGAAPPPPSVPDAGSTLGMLTAAMFAMVGFRRIARKV